MERADIDGDLGILPSLNCHNPFRSLRGVRVYNTPIVSPAEE